MYKAYAIYDSTQDKWLIEIKDAWYWEDVRSLHIFGLKWRYNLLDIVQECLDSNVMLLDVFESGGYILVQIGEGGSSCFDSAMGLEEIDYYD